MDRLNKQRSKAVLMGFVGVLLIVLGAKFIADGAWQENAPLDLDGKPALIFFTLDKSCECMQELIENADIQIKSWPEISRRGIVVHRINFEQRQDLASQYMIFRVPSMILLDAEGEIIHRQDYPSIEDGPFQLVEFEAKIQEIQGFGLK